MYSRVRLAGLALAIRTVALGGPKAAPVGSAGSAQPPALEQGQILRSKLALNVEYVHRQRASANASPTQSWTSTATIAKACAGTPRRRLRPEGLRSDLSIRNSSRAGRPLARAPADEHDRHGLCPSTNTNTPSRPTAGSAVYGTDAAPAIQDRTPRYAHVKTTSRRISQAYARDHFSRCR